MGVSCNWWASLCCLNTKHGKEEVDVEHGDQEKHETV